MLPARAASAVLFALGAVSCAGRPPAAAVAAPSASAVQPLRPSSPVPAGQSFQLDRGVVFDRRAGLVYMMAEGGIEALDPATGAVRWTSPDAAQPLLVQDSRLLAVQETGVAGRLQLVVLDAAEGAVLVRCQPIPIPAEVVVSAVTRRGFDFTVGAIEREGRLYAVWNSSLGTVGDNLRQSRGVLEIALDDGHWREVAALPDSGPTGVFRSDGWWMEGPSGVRLVGRRGEAGIMTVELHPAPVGDARAEPIPLATDLASDVGSVWPSADWRHALVLHGSAGLGGWSVFSTETGARILRSAGAAPSIGFIVWDEWIVSAGPRPVVRVLRLATGEEVWRRTARRWYRVE